MAQTIQVTGATVTLDSPQCTLVLTGDGMLTLKDAAPAPICTVAPEGGDETTEFAFASPRPDGIVTGAWAVAAKGVVRTFFPATLQGDGTYRASTRLESGTYTYQFEFVADGEPAWINPTPGTTLVVTAAQPPVPWVPTVPTDAGPLRREGAQLVRPDGKPVRLFGRHTWDTVLDAWNDQRWRPFDFAAYLAQMAATGENCTRLWRWEQAFWWTLLTPPDKVATGICSDPFPDDGWVQPWRRPQTGDPRAHDGLWKFDLSHPDPRFYARVRERVLACQGTGVYPIVMLHEGCRIRDPQGEDWLNHPMHPANNVQGWGSTRDAIYQPGPLRDVWDDYLARMVAVLADCPMVLWEVANEARVESLAWQEWVMATVRGLEAGQPIRHPIGMTCMDGGTDEQLVASSADWIAPGSANYRTPNFANATGRPCFLDSDHLWGMGTPANGCTPAWVQQAAANGYHCLLMDPHLGNIWPQEPTLDPVRAELGRQARALNA